MNIAKFCIRHKVTTLLAVIMIAVFGVVYTTQLQMALLPNIEYPAAYVYCYYNGAGPEDIEQLVTRPLESAIMSVPGVDSVTSSSADSISTIQIMYVENTDVDIAATKLREKFDALSLPDGCGSPVILNINVSEMMPSAIVGLLGDDLAALQQQAENVVAPALERIDGVASVSVSGGVERQITVTLDAQRAAGYGLSTSYITQILQAENLLYPAGEVYNGSQKISVTTDAAGGELAFKKGPDVRLRFEEVRRQLVGQNIVLTRIAARQAGLERLFAFALKIAVRRIEVVEARLQKRIDHPSGFLKVHAFPVHRQAHAAKAEILLDVVHPVHPFKALFH